MEIDITVPVWLLLTFSMHWVCTKLGPKGNYYLEYRTKNDR